jgi:uracil-DNA glycosylase family 4
MDQGPLPTRDAEPGRARGVTDAERRRALEVIAAEVAVCTRCRLHQGRTRAVPGEGNPDTEVMFVGEGPGFNEDRQGRPFVGQAGALLERLLASIQWRRDEVFIANVVKCRPPDNRDPEPDEIAACAPYLTRQIEALDPALIVTLGRFSMARFNPGAKISQVHGTFRPSHPDAGAPRAMAYFMYHPAAALRAPAVERISYEDIRSVPAALVEARASRSAGSAQSNEPIEPPAQSNEPIEPFEPVGSPVFAADSTEPAAAQAVEPAASVESVQPAVVESIARETQSDPTDQLTLF